MKKILISCLTFMLLSCGTGSDKEEAEVSSFAADMAESPESSRSKSETSEQEIQSGQITAAEWKDLANWNFWDSLNQQSEYSGYAGYWKYNLNGRISVNLKNNKSENLVDYKVELLDDKDNVVWQAKTDNKGCAELWPMLKNGEQSSIENLKIKAGKEQLLTVLTDAKSVSTKKTNTLLIKNAENSKEKKIDIAFVVDATGSMGDELEFLKAELLDVINRVKEQNPKTGINMASVFYRDKKDEYLSKHSDFSTDINQTLDFIKKQSAGGGGDFPEAVHTALNEALNNLQWSGEATSRLLFLVLDAPPHYQPEVLTQVHNLVALAAKMGVKIIPITASGIDKETEFLMRYMAITTNGTYIFITNDSGIGNDHLQATVGDHKIELLNKLLERVINENLE